ncbi:hypothetical protein QAD02_012521 [Eretmocerus hayati]|uniref:Uncharacterized protein n=1 Tax=Eretmocerus hayati TaxID=131215 RepID=A0ACC2NZP2_9HYME|nr:hypothetical protein QAD02_012521 [Eretmocerus hayati]
MGTGSALSFEQSPLAKTHDGNHLQFLQGANKLGEEPEQPSSAYLRDDPLFDTLQLQQHSELRAPTAERAAFYLDVASAARQREDGDTHMLYTLHVYQYSVAGKGGVAGGRSRLHLIDIGNSERGKSSGGIPLSGVGNILLAIFNGHKHLPYKEHKLAQLLRECLGSLTCHATMIAHVSPESQHYSETLTTCQLASRIHRMRRRKITRFGIGTQANNCHNNNNTNSNNNNGNGGGSSGDEQHQQHKQGHNSECDPSSSDLSADTVIYVGPSTDDATDGEHPPVYIPSLNSGDNRCAMNRILRGSGAERPSKIVEERSSPAHKASKIVKALVSSGSKQTSPAHSSTPKASPARKLASKLASGKPNDSSTATTGASPATGAPIQGASDEQWIDGPRISRSKVAEVRHLLLKDPSHKKETWIDGPMGSSVAAPSLEEEIIVPPPLPLIEPLSNGVSREVSMESLNLLSHKDALSLRPSRNSLSSEDEVLEIVDIDESALANVEHAPMQDSCLQVTEEDIALCMADNPVSENGLDEHPLRILSQENLTIVSTLADSLSVLSETERFKTQFPPSAGMGMPSRSYFDHEDFLEQENRHKFDQLARLHELYQSQLALANVTNSVTYQREKSSVACNRDPLKKLLSVFSTGILHLGVSASSPGGGFRGCPPSRCQSLSLSDVALSDAASTHGSIYSEPPYAAAATVAAQLAANVGHEHQHQPQLQGDSKFCDNCRQSLSGATLGSNSSLGSRLAAASGSSSTWGTYNPMPASPRRGYCVVAAARANASHISSLRHPDGASNPNLKDELCGVGGGCDSVRRLPGNGASGSDPEDAPGERAKRMHRGLLPPPPVSPLLALHRLHQQQQPHVTVGSSCWTQIGGLGAAQSGSSAGETGCGIPDSDVKFPNFTVPTSIHMSTPTSIACGTPTSMPSSIGASMPPSLPSSAKTPRKILSLGSSQGLNKDDYDSGADSTSRAAKLSPATLSRHRAESSGYDSVVRDSETSSIASDSSRQTSALQDHHGGALGVLTSTLCGCFSGGSTTARVRAPGATNNRNRGGQRRPSSTRQLDQAVGPGSVGTATPSGSWQGAQHHQDTLQSSSVAQAPS